jgi:predicted small integral membrane protein
LSELVALHLDDTACTDVALLIATALPHLARLTLRRTAVTADGVRVLAARCSLTELLLSGCDALTEEGLTFLSSQARSTRLDLARLDSAWLGLAWLGLARLGLA